MLQLKEGSNNGALHLALRILLYSARSQGAVPSLTGKLKRITSPESSIPHSQRCDLEPVRAFVNPKNNCLSNQVVRLYHDSTCKRTLHLLEVFSNKGYKMSPGMTALVL